MPPETAYRSPPYASAQSFCVTSYWQFSFEPSARSFTESSWGSSKPHSRRVSAA